MKYDVVIVGAGVVGGMVARELSKYRLSVCLLEKENDVAMGASRANSGIIHGGYDPEPGTLKAELNSIGAAMLFETAKELNVHHKKCGSMVCAFGTPEEEAMVETLKELRSELKNGGDLKSIINDALKERRRVAGLKDVMIEERARMRSEGVPDEEVVEYERACNKKLAELGAKPMITKELIIKKGLERKGLLVE